MISTERGSANPGTMRSEQVPYECQSLYVEVVTSPMEATMPGVGNRMNVEDSNAPLLGHVLRARKMEAMGALAGGIAHDFNNLLSAIMGNAELARTRLAHDHSMAKYLDRILHASARGRDLVQQILAFSREQEPQRKPVLLHEIISEAIQLVRVTLPATIEIRSAIPEEGPTVLGDATQLFQIIMNLVTNAAHAMESGGVLDVMLRTVTVEECVPPVPRFLSPGTYVLVTVGDTGHGMSEQTLNRIFEPFFTTKDPGKGMGLGLFVVHGIVKSHGGLIEVHSKVGEGTRFELYFPVSGMTPEAPTTPVTPLPRGRGERLLVVDDEPALAEVVAAMVSDLGYQGITYDDPQAALDEVKNSGYRYAAVLSDLTMPHMSGIGLAKNIKEIRPDLPFILMTGCNQPAEIRELGIQEVVQKPFGKNQIALVLNRIIYPKGVSQNEN